MENTNDRTPYNKEKMKTYNGSVEITKENEEEWTEKLKNAGKITGYLLVDGTAQLTCPALTKVGGDLLVDGTTQLTCPALTEVGGYLLVDGTAQLTCLTLTEVGGDLLVYGTAQLTCPALTEAGGDLRVDGTAQLTCPALTEVGGDLLVDGTAQLTCPALTEVGGDLLVYGKAQLTAPNKTWHNPKPIFKVFEKKGYLLADKILSKIISKKKSGQIISWKTRRIGSQKILYAAQRGKVFSHGETPKQAAHDLDRKS